MDEINGMYRMYRISLMNGMRKMHETNRNYQIIRGHLIHQMIWKNRMPRMYQMKGLHEMDQIY